MNSIKNGLRSSLTLCAVSAWLMSPAHSHAVVVLPLAHVAKAAVSLKGLVHHQPVALPGTGSATVRINNEIIKSIITKGYANGQNFAINNSLGGSVSSANLTGKLYFNSGGTTYVNIAPGFNFGLAAGSSPLNLGSAAVPVSSFPGNSITFANLSSASLHGGKSLTPLYSAGISGALRARTALYRSLAGASTTAGAKSITALGPIVGGEFFGHFGPTGGGFYFNGTSAAYAFGNNPLNSASIFSANASQLSSFLTFANGSTRTILGGQILGTLYQSPGGTFIPIGFYGLTFGNSPFSAFGTPYPIASIKNAIYLAALMARK